MANVLMATSYPILAFGAALLMLGLAKLGKVKINNAATMCMVAGIVGVFFSLFLYKAGLPHLVGLMVKGQAAPLGDKLGPALLKLASVIVIFSMLFIMVGLAGTQLVGVEVPSTGVFAIIVGLVTAPFGAVIFGVIMLLGLALMLYSAACVIIGIAIRSGKGIAPAAAIIALIALVNIGLGLAFQFGWTIHPM